MKRKINGFTLLELMIAVAIIGILSSIALPKYQQYVTKSQITSLYTSMLAIKNDYEIFILEGKDTSINLGALGYPDTFIDPALGKIKFTKGTTQTPNHTIQLTLEIKKSKIQKKKIIFKRNNGFWQCESDLDTAYQPTGCVSENTQEVSSSN